MWLLTKNIKTNGKNEQFSHRFPARQHIHKSSVYQLTQKIKIDINICMYVCIMKWRTSIRCTFMCWWSSVMWFCYSYLTHMQIVSILFYRSVCQIWSNIDTWMMIICLIFHRKIEHYIIIRDCEIFSLLREQLRFEKDEKIFLRIHLKCCANNCIWKEVILNKIAMKNWSYPYYRVISRVGENESMKIQKIGIFKI